MLNCSALERVRFRNGINAENGMVAVSAAEGLLESIRTTDENFPNLALLDLLHSRFGPRKSFQRLKTDMLDLRKASRNLDHL